MPPTKKTKTAGRTLGAVRALKRAEQIFEDLGLTIPLSYEDLELVAWHRQRARVQERPIDVCEGHATIEGELTREATIRKFRIVRTEGKREVSREIEHYNLQAIIAVGMRVRSQRGTQFRQWANAALSEYLVKGFLLDDQRLGPHQRLERRPLGLQLLLALRLLPLCDLLKRRVQLGPLLVLQREPA